MARPAKAVDLTSSNLTKEERESRQRMEKILRGDADKIKPPRELTPPQKKIFKNIVNELPPILGNIDVYILTRTAVTLDYLNTLEKDIRENPEKLYNAAIMQNRDRLNKEFCRFCNELSLSPQARAKLSIPNDPKKESSPLKDLLEAFSDE